MKCKVIGSHLCPDTLYALHKLTEAGIEMDFINLSSSLDALKEYLKARETSGLYDAVRAKGGIGIPCFVLGDGAMSLDLSDVLKP